MPSLEYMLISIALRLAQSKGFHLQPIPSERVLPDEVERRRWIFWSIYSYEKHIAYVSGRPSVSDLLRTISMLAFVNLEPRSFLTTR